MAKGILRKLHQVERSVSADIVGYAERGGLYARGLASEGYAAGYRAAISDVMLALRGCDPCNRPEYWKPAPRQKEYGGRKNSSG